MTGLPKWQLSGNGIQKKKYEDYENKRNACKNRLFGMLLVVLAGIHLAIPDFYRTVWALSTSGNMQGTIAYLRSFGIWAVAVSMIIDIVINIVGFFAIHLYFDGKRRRIRRVQGTVVSGLPKQSVSLSVSSSCGLFFP